MLRLKSNKALAAILCLCTAVFAGSFPAHAQHIKNQAQMVSLFDDACLNTFTDEARIDAFAQKKGFSQINESQWGRDDTATNIIVFRAKAAGKPAKFDIKKLAGSGWSFVAVSLNDKAARKRKQTGCAVIVFGLPSDELAQRVTRALQGRGATDLKMKSQGRITQSKLPMGGEKAVVMIRNIRPNKDTSFAFVSIIALKAN